ncbi:nucleotide exchange factor GrpE [candidate division KSB1 bacterium]|nr:nucleotide exchange factor GrpE [candidate division KSB1 bacterium]RQW00671.1 MAG: nucleotide exchange factor GrpE [candidate division KSB1 bacterium]
MEKETETQKANDISSTTRTKRRNYKKELEQAIAEKNELQEKLLRTAAEFDNYRKRVNNERAEWIDRASADLIASILPILDDLERFAAVESDQDFETLHKGVVLILKNFQRILDDYGLVELDTINKPFDPEKHDALLQVQLDDVEPDTVVEQHLKGYEFRDKVIRHAKVIVSK